MTRIYGPDPDHPRHSLFAGALPNPAVNLALRESATSPRDPDGYGEHTLVR